MRSFHFLPALFASLALAATSVACGVEPSSDAAEDSIVDIGNTSVKKQTIGNCWIYASVGWTEVLHKQALEATGADAEAAKVNFSEAYLTYWSWYQYIVSNYTDVDSGGAVTDGLGLIWRYGIVAETDFIPNADTSASDIQSKALAALEVEFKTGALKTEEDRRDPAKVREVLDRVWKLRPQVVAYLDKAFGKDVRDTLDRRPGNADGTPIRVAEKLPAVVMDHGKPIVKTLKDALGRDFWKKYMWHSIAPDSYARGFYRSIQHALHDRQPVVLHWFLDESAMQNDGSFRNAPKKATAKQGSHIVVLSDYQATVPGYGLLKAGVAVTDPKILEAALSEDTKVEFLRIKNSWGLAKKSVDGMNDLYATYLESQIPLFCPAGEKCSEASTDAVISAYVPDGY